MKIAPKELQRALKIMRPVVSANPIIPVLENVKIINNEVIGTNLKVSIKEKIQVDGEGEFLFPLTELISISNKCTEEITLQHDKITSGKDKYKLGTPEDKYFFPSFEESIEGVTISVHEEIIQSIITASKFTNKDSVLNIASVHLYLADHVLTITAVTGISVYRNTFNIQAESDGVLYNVLVPVGFIKCLSNLSGACDITVGQSKISISNGSTCIIGALSEGKFPDCSLFFKSRKADVLTVNRFDFVEALNKVSSVYDSNSACIISFKDKSCINFSLVDHKKGFDAATSMEIPHVVKTDQITVNGTMFIDLLNALPPNLSDIDLHIQDFNRHILVRSDENNIQLAIQPITPLNT